ncbi:MAG: glycosyltransferase family 4 protein [Nitrospirae bacterium]|nr:glycosyltransferase family 4 protein [Nitrospirota bacterium]
MKIAMLIKNFVKTGGAERYAVELSTRLARRGHDVHVFAQRWDPDRLAGITVHPIARLHRPRFINSLYYALAARRLVMREPCQFGCRALTHVVAVSEGTRRDILAHYPLDQAAVRVIYPGVNPPDLSPEGVQSSRREIRKQYDLSDEDLVIVFVGSEFKRKGLRYALEALALLLRNRKDDQRSITPHLLVVGRGDPADYLALASQLGIGRQVHFTGLQRDVWPIYAAADVCLLPTLGDTFSLAVLEAMACGLPVIVSRQAGVAELLRHGYNGLLLDDPHDPRLIAESMRRLFSDQSRTEMGCHAKETAAALSWDRMTDEMEALYHEAVRQRTGSQMTDRARRS